MKRLLLIMLPMLMLVVGCDRSETEIPESGLYKRYAQRPELKVAQVCGFGLNDSVQVDVVLLQAEDEAAWLQMAAEFGLQDSTGTTSWLGDTLDPTQRVAWDGQPVVRVIASHERQSIGLYRIENEMQYDALIDYQLNHIAN